MAKTRKNQQGYINTSLAFFAVLWLLSVFALFSIKGIHQTFLDDISKIKAKVKDLESQQGKKEERLHEIESLTGFYGKDRKDIVNNEQVEVLLQDIINNLNTLNTEGESADSPGTKARYGLMQLGYSSSIEEEKLIWKNYPLNIEAAINAFHGRIKQLNEQKAALQKDLDTINRDIANKKDERRTVVQSLQSQSQTLKQQLDQMRQKYRTQISSVKKGQQEALRAKRSTEDQAESIKKKMKEDALAFSNQINKRKNEIRRLQAAKYGRTSYSEFVKLRNYEASEESIDGDIVFSDAGSNTTYVSLGKKQNIMRGLKFDVYRQADRGNRKYVGQVEVSKVMDSVSMAITTDGKKIDPIVAGDLVINPIFSKNTTIHVVFAGKLSRYSNEQTKKLIEAVGGKVERKISAKTNFIIVAKNKGEEHKNYAEATRFGVPLMKESTLFRYIGD